MPKILITGAGTLATKIQKKIGGVTFSHRYANYIGSIEDKCKLSYVFKEVEPDFVIHTAALNGALKCQNKKREAIKTNVIGSLNVLEQCRLSGAKPICISSLDAGSPLSVYGGTKRMMELLGDAVFIRLGHILSQKSIFYKWYTNIINGDEIEVTDLYCTRRLITLNNAANFVIGNMHSNYGIYTPDMSCFCLRDVIGCLERITKHRAKTRIIGLPKYEHFDYGMPSRDLDLLEKILRTML